jgi:Lon protease-like protein
MTETIQLPIFPLGTVLYPAGRLPLRIFEARYLDMTKACIRDESVFGVCLIRDGSEAGAPAVPHALGCTARIVHWDVPHAGLFSLVTVGEQVFRIHEHWTGPDGLVQAQVRLQPALGRAPLRGDDEPLARLLQQIIAKIGGEHFPIPQRLDDAGWVAYRLAEVLPLEPELKLRLLAMRDARAMLAELRAAIAAF